MRRLMIPFFFILTGCFISNPSEQKPVRWAVYYGDTLSEKTFKGLDLVVFDRRYHPPFQALQRNDTVVLAYVSAGEVYDDVPEKKSAGEVYDDVPEKKALIEEKSILFQHDDWKSHVVDPTSARWQGMVKGYVNNAVIKGVDGVMIDTVDSPLDWAEAHAPARQEAMRLATIQLISDIRAAHPHIKIMLNRGLGILPDVASKIDYVLAESILTNRNVSTGQFEVQSPTSYGTVVQKLHQVVATAPHLKIFTLDYWNQEDVNNLERIYAQQRAAGFTPYVTTRDLVHYTPEPVTASSPPDAKG